MPGPGRGSRAKAHMRVYRDSMTGAQLAPDYPVSRGSLSESGVAEALCTGKPTCHSQKSASEYDYVVASPELARLTRESKQVRHVLTVPHRPVSLGFHMRGGLIQHLVYKVPSPFATCFTFWAAPQTL